MSAPDKSIFDLNAAIDAVCEILGADGADDLEGRENDVLALLTEQPADCRLFLQTPSSEMFTRLVYSVCPSAAIADVYIQQTEDADLMACAEAIRGTLI